MLDPSERQALETRIRELHAAADYTTAATLTLQQLGPEILGYLAAIARDQDAADEAFSIFCESLWKGMAGFRGEASMRTWAYTLARHALGRLGRDPHRARARRVPLSDVPELEQVAEHVRSTTRSYLRTPVKDRVAQLRAELDPADQTLFVLRISRGMSWADIARVMCDEPDPAPEQVKRDAWRLRKRFERTKQAIADRVRAEGVADRKAR